MGSNKLKKIQETSLVLRNKFPSKSDIKKLKQAMLGLEPDLPDLYPHLKWNNDSWFGKKHKDYKKALETALVQHYPTFVLNGEYPSVIEQEKIVKLGKRKSKAVSIEPDFKSYTNESFEPMGNIQSAINKARKDGLLFFNQDEEKLRMALVRLEHDFPVAPKWQKSYVEDPIAYWQQQSALRRFAEESGKILPLSGNLDKSMVAFLKFIIRNDPVNKSAVQQFEKLIPFAGKKSRQYKANKIAYWQKKFARKYEWAKDLKPTGVIDKSTYKVFSRVLIMSNAFSDKNSNMLQPMLLASKTTGKKGKKA